MRAGYWIVRKIETPYGEMSDQHLKNVARYLQSRANELQGLIRGSPSIDWTLHAQVKKDAQECLDKRDEILVELELREQRTRKAVEVYVLNDHEPEDWGN